MDLKCEIICVGSELLLGDTLNTNSYFLTKSLRDIGVDVYYHTTVGDNFEKIMKTLDVAYGRGMNIVITSGGLGPTDDDITKEASAKYFNKKLILCEDCVRDMENILGIKRDELTNANLKQAYIPYGGKSLKNDVGTAPGIILRDGDKIIINLPGPPLELRHMFNNYVKPYLESITKNKYYSEYIRLYGTSEGDINHLLSDLFSGENPTVAPYVGDDGLFLRLTSRCSCDEEGIEMISKVKDEIYKRIGDFIYAEGDTSIEELLLNQLRDRGFKISFGESCTGGMIASRFIGVSGASEFLDEAFITYSNESKINTLGVNRDTLDSFGAVSRETAMEMARGVLNKTNSNVAISSTGVAGPNKSEGKPVGLVYISVCVGDKTYVKEFRLIGDRNRVRQGATFQALCYAYDILRRT